MTVALTDKLIRELPAPPTDNVVYYDRDTTGFGLRVTKAGARVFVFRYKTKGAGADRTITIGDAGRWRDGKWKRGPWTLGEARKRAEELRRDRDAGRDPMGELHAERAAPTINDLADRFEAEYLPKRRPKTQKDYKTWLRLHIRPVIGARKVSAVERQDVERLHTHVAKTAPYAANRTLAVLSRMITVAIGWGMRADNPVRGVERAPEFKRKRYLTGAEIARLSEALAAQPDQAKANAIRLLLLTGARLNEVMAATWSQFDTAAALWVKPAATVKQQAEHRVPLSPPALQILVEMKAGADAENARRARDGLGPIAFLFGKPNIDIHPFWRTVCHAAGISGCRIHDLRHTHASILASQGLSLPVIGALLGHSQAATTHRYAHLFDDPLRVAVEKVAVFVENAGKVSASEVVPIAGGRRA